MSTDLDAAPQEVVDEDGDVDKALKRRIIQARERVDETELALYRDAEIEPDVALSEVQKVHIYGTTVKQFLRRIEPLLRTANVPDNEKYYKSIELGEITLIPPDTNGYQFSLVASTDMSDHELRKRIGLPNGVELPEPEVVEIAGLEAIIESDTVLSKQWEICVAKAGAPPNWEYEYPLAQQPIPKRIYEEGMRKADMFLQNAGIGLETDTKGSEIIRNFDQSGDEPSAEYGTGDYDANPDI